MIDSERTEPMDEQELVRRLKAGQEWAYRILVRRYERRLLSLAYGITMDREESRDIVQEAFVSACVNMASFREEASLSSWLHRIVVNHCLNWKRRWKRRLRWRHRPIETEEGGILPEAERGGGRNPETDYREKEMEHRLMEGIGRLPEKLRTVFVLSTFEDLSYDDIAEIVGIKRGTVSSRISNARKILKGLLAEGEFPGAGVPVKRKGRGG